MTANILKTKMLISLSFDILVKTVALKLQSIKKSKCMLMSVLTAGKRWRRSLFYFNLYASFAKYRPICFDEKLT